MKHEGWGEGNVFTGVWLSMGGGGYTTGECTSVPGSFPGSFPGPFQRGYPSPGEGVPQPGQDGIPRGQDKIEYPGLDGVHPSQDRMGYPQPGQDRVPPPPARTMILPPGQNSRVSTCYTVGAMPLVVTPSWGTPHMRLGYPLERTWDQWKYYGMEMGYTRVWTDRQTLVKAVPSPSFGCGR